MEMLKGRLVLCQWASYSPKGVKQFLRDEHASMSPMNRQDAYLSVEAWLACQPFGEAGFKSHIRGWYRNSKGGAVESINEPEKFRQLRLKIENIAAIAVLELAP